MERARQTIQTKDVQIRQTTKLTESKIETKVIQRVLYFLYEAQNCYFSD